MVTEDQSSPADEPGNQKRGAGAEVQEARLVRSRKTEPKREWARSPGTPVGKSRTTEPKREWARSPGTPVGKSRTTEPKREWARSPGTPVGKVQEDGTKEGVSQKSRYPGW